MPKSASTQQHIFNFQFSIINCPLIIIFLMTTILLISCEKEPYKACKEDPTCEYFRCKVNGEWWTPDCEQGPLFGCDHTDVQYYRYLNGGGLEMNSSSKKNNDGFYFLLYNVKNVNEENKLSIKGRVYSKYFTDKLMFYVDTTQHNEFILIELDTVKYIMSARFFFKGVDENGNTVSITEGEFRQHYRF